jgi:hypothetical protein
LLLYSLRVNREARLIFEIHAHSALTGNSVGVFGLIRMSHKAAIASPQAQRRFLMPVVFINRPGSLNPKSKIH